MKNARGMKVLYHSLQGIQAQNEEMMTFADQESLGANQKLKVVDFLIDLQISI
mgnify:CR=1 FL=1